MHTSEGYRELYEMDDPELEQFVLEKCPNMTSQHLIRQQSSGSNSSGEHINTSLPQTHVAYSNIPCPEVSTGSFPSVQPVSLTSSTTGPSTPVETLPPISLFSSNNSSFGSIYPHHEAMTSIGSPVSESNLLDLNGNIQERYNAVPHLADLPSPHAEQEFEDGNYQTHLVQSEFYSYNQHFHHDGVNVSYSMQSYSPDGIHEYPCTYATQNSFDSDDSFEVEYYDDKVQNSIQKATQIGHASRNVQHNSGFDERRTLPKFPMFTECKKIPSRRGRPVTFNKPGYHYSDSDSIHSDDERSAQSKGCRRGAKNILLWKFLLGELRKPNNHHIKWENEKEGIFKFVDTAECSRLWGQMKKKEDMNFEKLSRGIRHYYKDGLMSRRDGIRLVYKFNWERVPTAFWPRVR